MAKKELIVFSLSENEIEIVTMIRSLMPFEKVIVNADKNGKADNYLVERSHKVVLSTED